jgi:hypothetical protein
VKTRERSGGGGGGSRRAVPAPTLGAPTGGERLPMAPRERKPALAALAVLLILVGALGATVMVMRAGNKISVVEVTTQIASGEQVPESAIREVMISDGSGVDFIKWGQRKDLLAHYRAATNLTPGSLLVTTMITKNDLALSPGKSVVGLSLKDGQFPNGLKPGDTVAAYRVGNTVGTSSSSTSGTSGSTPLINDHLIIKTIDSGASNSLSGSGNTPVTVLVDTTDAAQLTIAASANQVSLVLVSASKN